MADVIVAGLDLGTNTTVLVSQKQAEKKSKSKKAAVAAFESQGSSVTIHQDSEALNDFKLDGISVEESVFRTVVGIPKQTILPGILPRGKQPLFGEEALNYKMHLDLFWPVDGTIADTEHARQLMQEIRNVLDSDGDKQVYMVVGSPANATADQLRSIRRALAGIVDKTLIVPEPFLAAMGYRDEKKLGDSNYHDPVVNTLFVDIGAGTTDLCKVQGYYPTEDDLISLDIAGNFIDKKLRKHIEKTYPDVRLADITVTRIKEENSFVGDSNKKVEVKVPVHGKHRTLDITQSIRLSCEELIEPIIESIEEMARRCDPDVVEDMLKNITLTGGGSQISGMAKILEKKLKDRDYLSSRVFVVEDYKPLVARGAMKTALKLKDDQWTIPM